MIDADLLNQAVPVTVAVATQKIVLIIKLNIILLAAMLAGQKFCIITHDVIDYLKKISLVIHICQILRAKAMCSDSWWWEPVWAV